MTGNKGLIKVPLSCYFEYKGILIICKAVTGANFSNLTKEQFKSQIESFEGIIKLKLKSAKLRQHSERKYLIIEELQDLLPKHPNYHAEPSYLREELVMQTDRMIGEKESIGMLEKMMVSELIPDFVEKL